MTRVINKANFFNIGKNWQAKCRLVGLLYDYYIRPRVPPLKNGEPCDTLELDAQKLRKVNATKPMNPPFLFLLSLALWSTIV